MELPQIARISRSFYFDDPAMDNPQYTIVDCIRTPGRTVRRLLYWRLTPKCSRHGCTAKASVVFFLENRLRERTIPYTALLHRELPLAGSPRQAQEANRSSVPAGMSGLLERLLRQRQIQLPIARPPPTQSRSAADATLIREQYVDTVSSGVLSISERTGARSTALRHEPCASSWLSLLSNSRHPESSLCRSNAIRAVISTPRTREAGAG